MILPKLKLWLPRLPAAMLLLKPFLASIAPDRALSMKIPVSRAISMRQDLMQLSILCRDRLLQIWLPTEKVGAVSSASRDTPVPDPLIKYAGVMAGQEFKGTYLPQELVAAYNLALTAPDQASKISLTKQFLALAVDKYCIATYLCVQSSPIAKSTVVRDDLYGEDPFGYISPGIWLNR